MAQGTGAVTDSLNTITNKLHIIHIPGIKHAFIIHNSTLNVLL